MLRALAHLLPWTIVVAYLLFCEYVDTKGRMELIEKDYPRLWKLINNRPIRLALIVITIGFLVRGFGNAIAIGPPPVVTISIPAPKLDDLEATRQQKQVPTVIVAPPPVKERPRLQFSDYSINGARVGASKITAGVRIARATVIDALDVEVNCEAQIVQEMPEKYSYSKPVTKIAVIGTPVNCYGDLNRIVTEVEFSQLQSGSAQLIFFGTVSYMDEERARKFSRGFQVCLNTNLKDWSECGMNNF